MIRPMAMIVKYLMANLIYVFLYDNTYRESRYFKGKFHGINAKGWNWILTDAFGRLTLRTNRGVRFPCSPFNTIINYKNIEFDPDDLHIFMGKGRYFQAEGAKIHIGKGTYIANNSALITSNHDIYNLSKHDLGNDIILGKGCWLGYGATILPGIILGDQTIVGAGAVVTKSFEEGHCIIGGVPARLIRKIDPKTAEETINSDFIDNESQIQ